MPDDGEVDAGPAADREDPLGRSADAPRARPDPSPPEPPRGESPEPPSRPDQDGPDPDRVARGEQAEPGEAADGSSPPGGRTEGERRPRPDAAGSEERSRDGSRAWSSAGAEDGGGKAASRSSTSSFFRELPVLLLVAFLLAFLLRTFVLQVFFIPSGSMENTLQIDDRMVVEKITYLFREPVRGEIVVFEGESFGVVDPEATAGERVVRGLGQFLGVVPANARDYVKRVIGLPGDEILIDEGQVLVNGEALDEPYVLFEDASDFGPVTVPDGHLFFLGDNRPNSSDSRRGLGFVPTSAVVGRSAVIIWPLDHAGLLTGVEHEVDGTAGSRERLPEQEPGTAGDAPGTAGDAPGAAATDPTNPSAAA